jgi:hypothetical protein
MNKERESKIKKLLASKKEEWFEVGRQRNYRLFASLVLIALLAVSSFIYLTNKDSRQTTADQDQREGRVAGVAWYDSGWNFRKKVTIDHTKVDADLTDFPILINETDADLQANAKADGSDILFTSFDGVTKLSHEIETYDSGTGELVAHVKVPNLSSTNDTELYLYYGNDTCENQENGTDVWDSNTKMVQHSQDDPDPSHIQDSTSNNNDGTKKAVNEPIEADGKIAKAQDFDGVDDYVHRATFTGIPQSYMTIEAWIKTAGTSMSYIIQQNRSPTSYQNEFAFQMNANGTLTFWDYLTSSHGFATTQSSTGTVNNNTWRYVCFVKNGTSGKYYIDGVSDATPTAALDVAYGSNDFVIGKDYRDNRGFFNGLIDEVRISNVARSPEWIATEYNNQNSPSTFYTLSSASSWDTTSPTNPTTFNGWESNSKQVEIASGDWNNDASLHFEWSGAEDNEGGSGVDDYYLYFGTDETADPSATSGIIESDSSPHLVNSSTTSYTLDKEMTTNNTYYFRLSTRDGCGNLSQPETFFTYKYDNQSPDQVEYINVSPAGCSTATSFDFSWQEPTDVGGSGIYGYQYKLGSTGELKTTSNTSLSESSYQNLDNVFYLRVVDNAGNTSTWQTAVYCSIRDAEVIDGPSVESEPGSLVVFWRSDKETTSFVKVYQGNQYVGQLGQSTLASEHSVEVIGLEPSTKYRYKLVWTDENGNIGSSDWYTTQTAPPPQVKDLQAQILDQTTAIVSFNTTKPTLATIRYGKDNKYSKNISMGSSLSSSYSYKLTGLEPESIYQLSIRAQIESGYQFDSEKYLVETPPYPSIENLEVEELEDRPSASVKVTWSTNVKTSSALTLTTEGDSKSASNADLTTNHSLTVEGLKDSSSYTVVASGRDEYGNLAKSSSYNFETPPDSRPPKIFDVRLETSITGTGDDSKAQIIVSWQTDEPATSQVEYGIGVGGSSYQQTTTQDSSLSKNHTVIISELDPQRTYHLRAVSKDGADNISKGADNVVITGQKKDSVLDIIIDKLKETFGFLADIGYLI